MLSAVDWGVVARLDIVVIAFFVLAPALMKVEEMEDVGGGGNL